MPLDMPTITAVAVAVTAVLGLVLLQSWWRERTSPLTGWWGLAQLIMAAGIAVAGVASYKNDITFVTFGQAIIILSASLMWMSVREFEGRQFRPLWVLAWPAAFLVIAFSGRLPAFDERLIATCTMLAALRYAAAIELARDGTERLISRWPAVVLLVGLGIGYSAWLPLTLTMPIREACYVFSSTWFPPVVLIALLGRIALAFVVLAMVKEREELKQRHDALTDPLTGLPNRRALFDAAAELARHSKYLKGDPISVLVFDLDHFKKINDTFGHRLGDRVLQLFADTMASSLETGSIVGRLGGEEFAAILPGADLETAAQTAESVRVAFAASASVVDGAQVAVTVSVGAASHDDIDCDLGALFHRADGALYAAKSNGRNRVELIGPKEAMHFDNAHAALQSAIDRRDGQEFPAPEKWRHTRRYRRSPSSASPAARQRRSGPTLS
jgi:diguanylate cyclase (GGDEF)-like protein